MVLVWPKNSTLLQWKIPETPSANRCVEALLCLRRRGQLVGIAIGGRSWRPLYIFEPVQEREAFLGPMAGELLWLKVGWGAGSRWQHRCRWSCIVQRGWPMLAGPCCSDGL